MITFAISLYSDILSHYLQRKLDLYGDSKDDEEDIDLLEINQVQTSTGANTQEGTSQATKIIKKHMANKLSGQIATARNESPEGGGNILLSDDQDSGEDNDEIHAFENAVEGHAIKFRKGSDAINKPKISS